MEDTQNGKYESAKHRAYASIECFSDRLKATDTDRRNNFEP
jgi:hypothetical protein